MKNLNDLNLIMESKTTSSLKALLLRAWRERWTDLQWGIHIKTVLPRGVSGDVYNLADCILQQAVVGTGANQLVLSYLKHSLSAQLVSHAAVLQRLSKYNQFSKIYCITSLLEFLEAIIPGVACCSKEIVLATAVLSTTLWILNILQQCKGSITLIEKASQLLKVFMTDHFYISMICLARYNDIELFQETSRKCTELLSTLHEGDEIRTYIVQLENMNINMLTLPISTEKWPGTLIQCWLVVTLIGNPGIPAANLAKQLQVFQRLKGYDDSRILAELIRGSLIAFHSAHQTPHESQWGAYMFIKVPNILSELLGKKDNINIVHAMELILEHRPLLDVIDANGSSTSLKCLLDELIKIRLLSESQVEYLLEKRKALPAVDLETPGSGIPEVIIRAESTFSNILKTLSADYQKTQDVILGMIQQLLTGKNFQLILAVACSSNQLKTFVNRLIRFNECYKLSEDTARIQLFDISFVMLISIVQNYGTSVVLESDGDSLFAQWMNGFMVDRHKPKSPFQLLNMSDPVIVDTLIQQLKSGEIDFKSSMTLGEVLFNMPAVMREVLLAWEQGSLVTGDVKSILEAVREKTCCLSIAAATYLCSYMRTAPQDIFLKPVNMVQQLLNSPASEDESVRVRWQLTCEIIRKMQRDIHLSKSSQHLVSRAPATELSRSTWKNGITKGWFDDVSARNVHCLLDTAGARWMTKAVVDELIKLRFRDQLERGVHLALAIFHVDIVECTIELLSHILPQILNVDARSNSLTEPQLSALAYLTSYCLFSAWDLAAEDTVEEPAIKKPRPSDNFDDLIPDTPIEKLTFSLLQLLSLFETMQNGYIIPQTYFIFNFMKSLVEVKVPTANNILSHIPFSIISDLLKTLPDLFTYDMLLHLYDITSIQGRNNMAKDLCSLRNYQLKNNLNV